MKIIKRISLCGLSVLLLMPYSTVKAEETNEKEEVVYIVMKADGSTKSTNVVNIFSGGDIIDYGEYSSVKMLTTNDAIEQNGDEITFYTDADKVYYQGALDQTEIPWNIEIQYYMNDVEYTPSEIAGKSGNLKIKFIVTKNENCEKDFYDNYALQASFTLDTDQCSDITADGATIANVGNDKQLTYTILPGKGIDTEITATVKDFEMDAVSINGVKLNLNVEVDTTELTDKVAELIDATNKLNDGTTTLADGSSSLSDGTKSVLDGTSSVCSGVESLDEGIASLKNGIGTMQNGLRTLSDQSESLTDGSSTVKNALETLNTELTSLSFDAQQLQELIDANTKIAEGIATLYDSSIQLTSAISYDAMKNSFVQQGVDIDNLLQQNEAVAQQLEAYASQLEQGGQTEEAEKQRSIATLLRVNSSAMNGVGTYLDTVGTNAQKLTTALKMLNEQYAEFSAGINTLVDSLNQMVGNMNALKEAISTISENYQTLDDGLQMYTNAVDTLQDGFGNITSGVSRLANESKNLLEGTGTLNTGVSNLYDATKQLCDGATELADGTNTMNEEVSGMDTEIEDKIAEVLDSLQGNDEVVSFVSEKNTHVKSVQFVMKTDGIKKEEAKEVEETTQKEESFIGKLLALFQ